MKIQWMQQLRARTAAWGVMLAVVTLGMGLPTTSMAAEDDECPLFFPDFRCERSGRFDGFERPISSPFLFEDPFITTGLAPTYVYHEWPDDSLLQGGQMHVLALQARLAITDKLAFIATKDGYAWNQPRNPLLNNEDGFFNIAFGLKQVLWQDREKGRIFSGIIRFEIPSGSSHVFQGFSDGSAFPSITGAWQIGKLNLIGDIGAHIPFKTDEQSTSLFYHLYADVQFHRFFQPFVQLSGQSWVDSGDASIDVVLRNKARVSLGTAQALLNAPPTEGADVINLGSKGMAGTTAIALGGGFHIPLHEHVTFTASWEMSVNEQNTTLYKQRFMTALTVEF